METGPDLVVIGGGIIGLATAKAALELDPCLQIVLLDKEPHWAAHQSGHNSNVIHSGLYYRPGSLKATMARDGGQAMIRWCEDRGLPVRRTGKLVVATTEAQLPRLAELMARGGDNGVPVREVSGAEVREREPHCAAVAALEVTSTAITDFGAVCRQLADELAEAGVVLHRSCEVLDITVGAARATVATTQGEWHPRMVVNCAGLHSDRVATMMGVDPPVRIVPFRGEYAALSSQAAVSVNNPIYPVPDPALPFLGIHLTPMLDGSIQVGPNAVPALAREGYRWRDIDPVFVGSLLTDRAVHRVGWTHWRHGVGEISRSLIAPLFLREVRRMLPGVRPGELTPSGSGVRAQAVDRRGRLVDDFVIVESAQSVHVLNAPSPAATSSLLIGQHVAERAIHTLKEN